MDYPIKLHTETVIDSAHFLEGYDGLCKNVHGHSWRIRVWIKGWSSMLDKVGILFDFNNIKVMIKDPLDHKLLNDVLLDNPTAENIALSIYKGLKSKHIALEFVVRVYETSIGKETWCETGDWEEC